MLFEKREVPRMKSITEAIYDGWINERERRNKLPQDDPECIALSKFEDTLTKEQKGLFDQFMDAYTTNEEKLRKAAYGRGLKLGIRLGYEAANYDAEE